MLPASVFEELTTEAARDGVHRLVVGAVVGRHDTVLLLSRPQGDFMGGVFELPSGKVEPGETLEAALSREVTEETGLEVTAIPHYLGSFDYVSGSGKRTRQFNFVVDVNATEPVELTEHDAYRWMPLTEEPPTTEAVKAVVKEYRHCSDGS